MTNIPSNLKELTQKFSDLQLQCDKMNKTLSELREYKRQTETQLINAINNSGLSGYGITYRGQLLSIGQEITYDTLTYKFLEECLLKLFNSDQDKVKKIITFIKKQRHKTLTPIIKIGVPKK